MKKHLSVLMLLAAMVLPWAVNAQSLENYGFTTGVDATKWVDMTSATQILSPTGNDGLASSLQNIGFTFPFGASTYTQYSVNTDGNLRLGSTVTGTSSYSTPFSSSYASTNNPKINAFGCDGYGLSGTHYVKALMQETLAGDTMLVVEFCMGTYSSTTQSYLYKWQIHLYSDGNIDIVFPPASGIPAVPPSVAHQCGICASSSDGWVIQASTNSATHFTAGSTITNAANTWFDAGRYYSFVHPSNITCPAPTGLTASDITTNSATLSWRRGGNENLWELTVGENVYYPTDTFYAVSSLDGNTLYSASVRAICGGGDTSFAAFGSFRTACVAISSMPYENDFENEPAYSAVAYADALPACWARINDATSTYNYYPYITTSASYVIHGGQSMYWYHSTTATYANNQYAILPPVDLTVYDISDLTLSFFGRTTATAAPYPQFIVGVMTAPDSASTFVPLDTVTLTTTATLYSVSLDGYTGTGAYIAIRSPRTSTSTAKYAMLDDIYLTDQWCDAPEAVTASATSSEVTISWEGNGGSSFTVYLGGDTITSVTDTFYTFYMLTPDTIYNYGVATECASSNSLFITGTIHTECVPLTAADLPYYEDFESYGTGSASPISSCWAKGVVPITGSGTTTNYPYPYSTAAINGTRGLYFYAATTTSTSYYNWLALPPIDDSQLNMSDLMVTFNLKRTATSTHQAKLIVGVTTDYHSTAGFVPVDTVDFSSTAIGSVHEVEVDFSSYTGSGTYVLFYAPAPSSATTYNAFYIDDVTLRALPTCFWPSDVTTDSIASDGAVISWTPDSRTSNPASWSVEYGLHGFTPGEGTTETVYDTTITLYSLTPNTVYDIYVSANCGGDVSDPTLHTFRTSCVPIDTLPWVMDFEDVANGSATSHDFVPCMNRINNGTTNFGYPYVSNSTAASNHTVGGSKYLYWFLTTTATTYGDYEYAVLPPVNTALNPMNTLQVRFWVRPTSTSYHPVFQVGVMTDPDNINTFQLVETVDLGTGSSTFSEHTVAFGAYTGNGQYIAIRALRPSSAWYAAMDDIVIENMPPCPAVTNIEASASVGAALLTWDYSAGYEAPDNYVVTYDSIGGTNPVTLNATTNSISISGLTAGTSYKAYVKADCGTDGYGIMDSVEFNTANFQCAVVDTANMDTVAIGTGTSATSGVLVYSSYGNTIYQTIYKASELTAAGLTAGPIIAVDFGFGANTSNAKEFTVFMANSTKNSFSASTDMVDPATMTQVYGPTAYPTHSTAGWRHFEFATAFDWDGVSNILVCTFMNQPTGTTQTTSGFSGYGTTTSYTGISAYRYKDSSPYTVADYTSGTSGSTSTNRATVKFYSADCLTMAACAAPSASVTDVDSTSVTLAWSPGYNETSWDVDYRVSGTTTWNNAVSSNTTTTYTVTGLLPATEYEFRVGFACSDGLDYYDQVSAMTSCVPVALPYTENFDGVTTSTTAANYDVLPPCWDYTLIGASTYATGTYRPGVYYSATYASSGSYSLRIAGKGYFMLPEMSGSIDSLMISLNGYITAASYSNLVVGAMENGLFVPIDTAHLVTNEHTYVELLLSNYNGTSRTLAFFNPNTTTSTDYSYVYIDDLRVEYVPDCVRPLTVEAIGLGSDWATIAWDSIDDSYEVYVSTTSVDPDTVVGATFLPSTIDTLTLTGLTPNTQYYVYVRTICGINGYSDWSNEYIFRTACSSLPLPYTEDFESYTSGAANPISPCWVKGTNSTTAYPYPYTTNAVTGSMSLYFYAYHPSTTTATPYYSYAALPMFQDSTNHLMLSFNVRRYSTVSNLYTTRLVIGVMTNPNDISTFFPMDTLDLHDAVASSVHGYEYCFNQYTGTGRYLAIYNEVPPLYGSTYSYSYAYVDDIMVDTIPSCMRPQSVTINNIDQTNATVHWTASDNALSFDIEYGPSGFTPGMGTTVTSSYDSVDLTGLMPSTQYDVYVRAHCSATDVSSWSFAQSFATLCGPTALPMSFDLEGYATGTAAALPTCWTRTNNATGTVNYYPYIYNSSSYAHSGTNSLYHYFSTSSGYASVETMAFPEVDVLNYPMNTVEVTFWAKASTTGKHYIVGVMTNPSDATTFQPVDTLALTTTYSEYIVSYNNYTGTGAYVALRGEMEGTSAYYIYVDDIYISVMSHCPRVYDLQAYNGTANGVTLGWTDTIGSTQWVVSYAAGNDTNWTNVTVTANPYTLTGLTPNTVYRYRVAPICSDGIQADWSREVVRFNTSQVPATVPYTYNFEDGTEWANWQTMSNNTVNWYRGNAVGNPGYSMYLSADNGATRSMNMTAITNVAAYRDFDFGPTPVSYELTYDALIGGSTDGNYDGITIMVVDPAIIPENSSTGLTSPWGHISSVNARMDTVWSGESYYLDGMQGVKRLVFFHFNQATASTHPYIDSPDAIDNIAIGLQPCARPYDLAAENITDHSAQLTWAGPATDTYMVAYRAYGAAASTNVYYTVTGNSYVLSGLNSNMEYVFWVRHICSLTATDTLASDWSNGYRFTTECATYTLPYVQTFDSVPATTYNTAGELPDCWRAYSNGTTSDYLPHVVGSGSYWYSVGSTPSLTMTSGSATYGDTKIVALPHFNAPVSTCGIRFYYRHESMSYGQLQIGYVTGPDLEATFQPLVNLPACTTMTQIDSTLLSGAPANATRIALRWTHAASFYSVGIDNIEVWSSAVACDIPGISVDTVGETMATIHWVPTAAASYEVAAVQNAWVEPTNSTVVTGTTHTFTGLQDNTEYILAVRSVCGADYYSDWDTIRVNTLRHPCATPSTPVVSSQTFDGATVSWQPGENETAWDVHIFCVSPVFDSTFSATTDSVEVHGLDNGVTYSVAVRAMCDASWYSEWSDTVDLTTATCPQVSGVTASSLAATTATITWTSTGAANYEVEYGNKGFQQGAGTLRTTATNSIELTGLEAESSYDVFVRSLCSEDVASLWSNKYTFTTPEGTGIADVENGNVTLYPNPASTSVTLRGLEGECTVTVVDLNGREVYKTNANNTLTIDLSGYAKGAYFVRITGESTTAIRKLIVK